MLVASEVLSKGSNWLIITNTISNATRIVPAPPDVISARAMVSNQICFRTGLLPSIVVGIGVFESVNCDLYQNRRHTGVFRSRMKRING